MVAKEKVEQEARKSGRYSCSMCARYYADAKWCELDEESTASLGDVHEPDEAACPMFVKKEEA